MGRTLNRVAGVVSAAALATFAATPAALADDETPTSSPETSTSTSETSTTSSSSATTSDTPTTVPSSTSGIATATPSEVKTTDKRVAPKAEPELKGDTQEPPKDEPQQDNVGHGFVGLGGEGVLVIACAAGAPGNVATQYLDVTSGPDQDGANGLLWNYTVRVADLPAGTTTGKFSWTCAGVEGNGVVEFEQEQPPTTSTTTATSSTTTATSSSASPSSTAPVTTATSVPATTPSGNAAPKAQVKVAPKGGVETGFGGMAW
ncbi:hypothetical protein AB0J40_07010 [Amycolatopsis sp. NPDC049691]|uniref:hypothetical protein n=1 Tax=Amycolatopsis sp. NPDC049691 TaxID=3155155 RepID=UPI003448BCA6